jgi:phage N-6-adenine-methyltransferase
MHQLSQDNQKAHSLNDYSAILPTSGMWGNGWYSALPSLDCPIIESDCLSLPTPTALSSLNSRPPGQNKLEVKLKELGLIQRGEVANPELLEAMFGLPMGYSSPVEYPRETVPPAAAEKHSATQFASKLQDVPSNGYSTSIRCVNKNSVKELGGEYSTSKDSEFKAISLWQPWASLIPLGLKHYETRSWKTNYRGKLLICSTATNTKLEYQQYLKICEELQLPSWEQTNFPHGCAIAVCDLVDCIEMTQSFIEQQSTTEILCGDWQVGRYAWKLENIQPITEPLAVRGKQGLFNVSLAVEGKGEKGRRGQGEDPKLLTPDSQLLTPDSQLPNPKPDNGKKNKSKRKQSSQSQKSPKSKPSDQCYTPPHITELIVRVLGAIDLDPCADEKKHIPAVAYYTQNDDGLSKPWFGRVFFNPPYSCPGKWVAWFLQEYAAIRATEAIALLPAATDTNWMSPILKAQPVCFWKGRIKFLDENYKPMRQGARQSHVLVYWGNNPERFVDVFEAYGVIHLPTQFLGDKLDEQISPRKTEGKTGVEGNKNSVLFTPDAGAFLGDKLIDEISPRKIGSESEFLGDKSSNEISPRKTRRRKGDGSGNIHWRTVTKNGKDYQEAYYHYEFWNGGDRLIKSTKYIPKRLLAQVQRLEEEKAPVREILQVLGVVV